MTETQPPSVDFTQKDAILQTFPNPVQRSSMELGWTGICVVQHQQPAWEIPEYASHKHMILVHGTKQTVRAERWFNGHKQQEQIGNGNNVVIVPSGVLHKSNWDQESPSTLLFLDPDRLTQLAYEAIAADYVELVPHHAMPDPLIDQIGRSLTAELEFNRSGSQLFVDSLTTALSIHLLRHYANLQQPLREDTGGLSPYKLQQAIDYIYAHLTEDLTIQAIADQLQMSQYYFSRLFKQSMGISPYQYVMQQRIEQSALLLRTTTLSVAAIAAQVGFSNQNQLTIQFRKFMNTTPINYRRSVQL